MKDEVKMYIEKQYEKNHNVYPQAIGRKFDIKENIAKRILEKLVEEGTLRIEKQMRCPNVACRYKFSKEEIEFEEIVFCDECDKKVNLKELSPTIYYKKK